VQYRIYDRRKKEWVLMTPFGTPYFYESKTRSVSIWMPSSLIKDIDKKRGAVSRSRFICAIIAFHIYNNKVDPLAILEGAKDLDVRVSTGPYVQ
jgi:hypothetical protein